MSKLSDTGLASGSSVRLRFLLTVCSKADFLGKRCKSVAEQLHCLLHVKELEVTTTEFERQIGDWLKDY